MDLLFPAISITRKGKRSTFPCRAKKKGGEKESSRNFVSSARFNQREKKKKTRTDPEKRIAEATLAVRYMIEGKKKKKSNATTPHSFERKRKKKHRIVDGTRRPHD